MSQTAVEAPKTYNIAVPNTADLATGHASLLQEAEALAVTDEASHALALEGIRRATLAERQVDELFEEPTTGAFKAHKFLTSLRSTVKGHPARAKALFLEKANAYEAEARRKAEEEARKKQVEARKAEEDRQLADAEAAQNAGDPGLAEQILNERVTVPIVAPAPAVAKVTGVTTRDNWKGDGIDLMATVRFVAQHPEYSYLLTYNPSGLTSLARAQRANCKVPGVRVFNEPTKSVRS